jgi:hypothetical protein
VNKSQSRRADAGITAHHNFSRHANRGGYHIDLLVDDVVLVELEAL